MGEKAELKIGNKTYILPITVGSRGEKVIDISGLKKDTGYCTLDPGYLSTASCKSGITYIDGNKGELLHRGYDIKDLAENCSFVEVAYLLLYKDLPNQEQLEKFSRSIKLHALVNEQLRNLFLGFRHSAHPMAIMLSAVGSLSAFYQDYLELNNPKDRDLAATRIIAKIPTIAAMSYKYSIGRPFIYPRNELGFSENFLHMMFATPSEEYIVNPIVSKVLNKILILHADHEQNASTSTVRVAGSSGAHPFACISAGIASLWGPAHGGANEEVINMLKEIKKPENIPKYINKAKDKSDPFRLMGFGHRVYKNYDPRAEILRKSCKELLNSLDMNNNLLLQIAIELEDIALKDDYFIEKKLYPNVDFYSGIMYKAMGIPEQMFTVMFAVARSAGWMAQWKEMTESNNCKISRPRQLYIGEPKRDFIKLNNR